jgi:5-oxoprolinase (ATP-hydrolysing)
MDSAAKKDPVLLEIMNQRYMAIAEQMGEVLRRTALSTNIRDRLDFSCAVFDRDGGLIANAPHIPVHLGAMGESVRAVRALHPSMSAGDVFATNDPAAGGSHLPDITVVSPFFVGDTLRFFVANRGHHADVGGITPGSMPAFSSSIEEEGVVLRALRVVSSGAFDEHAVRAALASGLYPARSPDQNVQDLLAQIAANRTGLRLLQETIEEHGLSVVEAYMQHVRDNASMAVSKAIAELEFEERRFEDHLDDGTSIVVTARVREGRLSFDFSGTGAEVDGNLNAPRAVTLAAVLYVVRLMVGVDIPLNHGSWRDIDVILPEGSILSPGPGRAVAGGNVETSQRVVDVLLGALGLSAASQGTMNNLSFGNERFGYYETLGGGAGAGPWFHGASAVHTHMTNTRLTDPEVLERRFPVRVREMSVRRGSGGRGRYTGGDGLVRELEFLEPVTLSILSERRVRAPFGLCGGGPGQLGRNLLNGQSVGGKAERSVRAKDVLRIETPGGGGYGSASGTPE